jgi:DNA modification methylase
MIQRVPTKLDRYPAKMVSRLAVRLVDKYASKGRSLLDPFSGSGAVLVAAHNKGLSVSGVDINPISSLYSRVKLGRFDAKTAYSIFDRISDTAALEKYCLPIDWQAKDYWFTSRTLQKLESIRGAICHLHLGDSNEKAAILLALCLAVRICSRADQRSPKPFISKSAIQARKGRHFDPIKKTLQMLHDLAEHYDSNDKKSREYRFVLADLTCERALLDKLPRHSHVITSPPYINAQDYFRNFKLELYILEGLLPFRVSDLKDRFIGTERGNLLSSVSQSELESLETEIPELERIDKKSKRHGNVVRRYFADMRTALVNVKNCLEPGGVMVVVCGDNLVAGERIKTWQFLALMLERLGLSLFETFADPIRDRLLAPKRSGHKGLIKEEIVLAFTN